MYIQESVDTQLNEAIDIEQILESEGFEFLNEHKEIFMKFLNEDVTIALNESDISQINKSVGKYIKDAKEFLDNANKHADSVNPYTALNKAMLGVGLLTLFLGVLSVIGAAMDTPDAAIVFYILMTISALVLIFMAAVSRSENQRRYKVTTQHMNSLKTIRRKLLTFKSKTTNLKVEADIDKMVASIDDFLDKWSSYNEMDEIERAQYHAQLQKERDLQAKEAIARNTANPTVVIVREGGEVVSSF